MAYKEFSVAPCLTPRVLNDLGIQKRISHLKNLKILRRMEIDLVSSLERKIRLNSRFKKDAEFQLARLQQDIESEYRESKRVITELDVLHEMPLFIGLFRLSILDQLRTGLTREGFDLENIVYTFEQTGPLALITGNPHLQAYAKKLDEYIALFKGLTESGKRFSLDEKAKDSVYHERGLDIAAAYVLHQVNPADVIIGTSDDDADKSDTLLYPMHKFFHEKDCCIFVYNGLTLLGIMEDFNRQRMFNQTVFATQNSGYLSDSLVAVVTIEPFPTKIEKGTTDYTPAVEKAQLEQLRLELI